ncbi:MAG: leucine-rich repeat protein [Lachnospiraceae bacterium]|nr:leucine-rich repeat protein [Lachnospiraceae bacterium]
MADTVSDDSISEQIVAEGLTETVSGEWDTNLTWEITPDGTLTISGSGAMKSVSNASDYPWYAYREDVKNVVLSSGITSVGNKAFAKDYPNLTAVEIADTVKSFPAASNAAFGNNTALTSVTFAGDTAQIPANVCANMTALTSVIIDPTSEKAVTGIGNYAFYNCSALTSCPIPATVTAIGEYAFSGCTKADIVIPQSVTSIKQKAFHNCDAITSLTLWDGLTEIGADAFSACDGLTSIRIPGSLKNTLSTSFFKDCKNMQSVTFGYGIESIPNSFCKNMSQLQTVVFEVGPEDELPVISTLGNDAFYGCSKLENFPSNVPFTSIGSSCFYNCSLLKGVKLADSVTQIPNNAFYNCGTLRSFQFPASLKTIGNYAFYKCASLPNASLPGGVTAIGSSAFEGCSLLSAVNLDGTAITSIESRAFYGCIGLKRIFVPDSVTEIKTNAFNGCSELNYISLSSKLQKLESGAFANCIKLSSVMIPESLKNVTGDTGPFDSCSNLKTVTFSGKNRSIPTYLFSGCKALTNIQIPDTVLTIGSHSFYNCESLQSLTIPDGILEVGDYAFAGCKLLQKASLGNNCATLGKYAFSGCSSLSSVKLGGRLRKIQSYCFNGCAFSALEIPYGVTSIEAYALAANPNLTTVTIPGNVTSITNSAMNQSAATIIGESGSAAESFATTKKYTFVAGTAATSMTVDNKADLTLGLGEKAYRSVSVRPINSVSQVKWTVGDANIATIAANDLSPFDYIITAKKAGQTTVTVTCATFTYTWKVKVENRLTAINFEKENYYLSSLDKTVTLKYTVTPKNQTVTNPVWSSTDPRIASVDQSGVVTPKSAGVVRIIVKDTATGISDYCFVHVKVPEQLRGIVLDKHEAYLTKESVLLQVSTDPETYSKRSFGYAVDKQGIISVIQTESGYEVKAIGKGTAVMTVKEKETGFTDKCVFYCDPNGKPVTSVTLNQTVINTADLTGSFQMKASLEPADAAFKKVIWTSSDPSVAYVDENGLVTPLRGGEVTIYATTVDGGIVSGCKVVIGCPAQKLTISRDTLRLTKGRSYQLDAIVNPFVTGNDILEWYSNNTGIATVDPNGQVTGVAPGTTQIKCKTTDGSMLSAACTVTVVGENTDPGTDTSASYKQAQAEYQNGKAQYEKRKAEVTRSKQGRQPGDTTIVQKQQVVIREETPAANTKVGSCKLKSVKKKKNKLTVTWKKTKKADGYQIKYAKNKKMKKAKTKNVKGNKKTKVVISKVKWKTCYVKIRAYQKVGGVKVYGKWSKAKKVVTRS